MSIEGCSFKVNPKLKENLSQASITYKMLKIDGCNCTHCTLSYEYPIPLPTAMQVLIEIYCDLFAPNNVT